MDNDNALKKKLVKLYRGTKLKIDYAGLNLEECSTSVPYDYFFSSCSSIWGWASWSRVINQWDKMYSVLNDAFNKSQIQGVLKQKGHMKNLLNMAEAHKNSGKAHFESILLLNQYLNSGLTIVPKNNMINNIGVLDDSTHFSGSISTLPKGYRRVFTMKRYELEFPIKHPQYVIEYTEYKDRSYRIKAWGHPFVKLYRMVEVCIYKIAKGDFGGLARELKEKTNKALHHQTY